MPGASEEAKRDYEQALGAYERASAAVDRARSPQDLEPVGKAAEEGRFAMASARARLEGREPPERTPPCFFDPRHGPSAREVEWSPPWGEPRAGARPARPTPSASSAARTPIRARSPSAASACPYWNAGPAYAPYMGGFFGGGLLPGIFLGSLLGGGMFGGGYGGWGGEYRRRRRHVRRRRRRGLRRWRLRGRRLRRRRLRRRRRRLRRRRLLSAASGLAARLPPMASTERSVEIARPPAEVFPWLFEEDKVPQWTTGLEHYERLDSGPLGQGARFQQKLEVSGQRFTVEMEVFEYDPPRSAASSFEIRGVDVVTRYALAERRRHDAAHPERRGHAAAASRAGSSSR